MLLHGLLTDLKTRRKGHKLAIHSCNTGDYWYSSAVVHAGSLLFMTVINVEEKS